MPELVRVEHRADHLDPPVEDFQRSFAEANLGKKAIECRDSAGFVVNALLIPFILAAIRMLESGYASAEDIDEGLIRGCAHPQGPSRWPTSSGSTDEGRGGVAL